MESDLRFWLILLGAAVAGFVLGRLTAGKGEGGYVGQAPGARSAANAPSASTAALSAGDAEAILALLRQGNKIEAIKRYRELCGSDLKGAKDAIEALERRG